MGQVVFAAGFSGIGMFLALSAEMCLEQMAVCFTQPVS
jgi:hypothetical protein